MIFEARKIVAPYFASAEVSIIDLVGEVEVYSLDIVGYDCCSGPSSNVEELFKIYINLGIVKVLRAHPHLLSLCQSG